MCAWSICRRNRVRKLRINHKISKDGDPFWKTRKHVEEKEVTGTIRQIISEPVHMSINPLVANRTVVGKCETVSYQGAATPVFDKSDARSDNTVESNLSGFQGKFGSKESLPPSKSVPVYQNVPIKSNIFVTVSSDDVHKVACDGDYTDSAADPIRDDDTMYERISSLSDKDDIFLASTHTYQSMKVEGNESCEDTIYHRPRPDGLSRTMSSDSGSSSSDNSYENVEVLDKIAKKSEAPPNERDKAPSPTSSRPCQAMEMDTDLYSSASCDNLQGIYEISETESKMRMNMGKSGDKDRVGKLHDIPGRQSPLYMNSVQSLLRKDRVSNTSSFGSLDFPSPPPLPK